MVDSMSQPHAKDSTSAVPVARSALAMIVVGMACAILGPAFFDGVVKGLFLGAGVALMLLGVFVISAAWRRRPGGSWLPSRDE